MRTPVIEVPVDTPIDTTIVIDGVEYHCKVAGNVTKARVIIRYRSRRFFLDYRFVEELVHGLARSRSWSAEELVSTIAAHIAEHLAAHAGLDMVEKASITVRMEFTETGLTSVAVEAHYP